MHTHTCTVYVPPEALSVPTSVQQQSRRDGVLPQQADEGRRDTVPGDDPAHPLRILVQRATRGGLLLLLQGAGHAHVFVVGGVPML